VGQQVAEMPAVPACICPQDPAKPSSRISGERATVVTDEEAEKGQANRGQHG
jgi:hypothetical protein